MRDQVAAGLRIILFGALLAAGLLNARPSAPEDGQEVTPVADRVAALVAQHDCSVFGYPEGVIPSGSVVDTGTGPRYAPSGIAFKIAFENHPGTVYAFCL